MAESGGDPFAINFADPGGSYGLTQINAAANGPTATDTLGNPTEAFTQMFNLSNGGTNFSPWSTFNSGAYLPFLSQLGGSSGAAGSSSPLDIFGIGSIVGGGQGGLGIDAGGIGSIVGGGSGGVADALGNTSSSSASPLSQIFTAIENFFQRAAFIMFGIVLVAIGVYFLTKPQIDRAATKIAKAAA